MWVISWRLNGKVHIEKYEDYKQAVKRLEKLINKKMRPTLHQSVKMEAS